MQTEHTYIVHPTSEQASALKAFIKALKIKFEVATNENPYNPDFVAKIKKSKKESQQGGYTRVAKADLQNFLGV
jgi:hypothetical protein